MDTKKAKTHKGKKILEKRKPQLIEGPKQTLFFKSTTINQQTTLLMKDLWTLKKQNSIFIDKKKFDLAPFDNVQFLEHLCNKNHCGLFVYGSHSKKKPNSITIGRIFNESLLDMAQLGFDNYQGLSEFKKLVDFAENSRPALFFQGDLFEYDAIYMRLKNLFMDLFIENIQVQELDILRSFTHSIVFSIVNEKIYMRTYQNRIKQDITKNDETAPVKDSYFDLQQIGPICNFAITRTQFASVDEFDAACKQPKKVAKAEQKNISKNALGDTVGRIFIQKEDFKNLALKKRKKIKKEAIEDSIKMQQKSEPKKQ